MVALRRAHPVFRRRRFLAGAEASELGWYTPSGTTMTAADWGDPSARSLALYLDGSDDPARADDGSLLVDDDFLFMVNSWWEPLEFLIPAARPGQLWYREIDTFDPAKAPASRPLRVDSTIAVGPRSVVVLRGLRGLRQTQRPTR